MAAAAHGTLAYPPTDTTTWGRQRARSTRPAMPSRVRSRPSHSTGVVEYVSPKGNPATRPTDLQALRDAGIDGIVLPLAQVGGDVAEALGPYSEAIAKLKIKSRADRGVDDAGPFLPRMGAAPAAAADDGDDEDEGE